MALPHRCLSFFRLIRLLVVCVCVCVAVETLCLTDSPVKTFHSGPFDLSEQEKCRWNL